MVKFEYIHDININVLAIFTKLAYENVQMYNLQSN